MIEIGPGYVERGTARDWYRHGFLVVQAPVSGPITSPFADQSEFRTQKHSGIDIYAPWGTPIRHCLRYRGVVEKVWDDPVSFGHGIDIRDLKTGHMARYLHMASPPARENGTLLKRGDEIQHGEIIGRVGNTGFVRTWDQSLNGGLGDWRKPTPNTNEGTHLHLSIYGPISMTATNLMDPLPLFVRKFTVEDPTRYRPSQAEALAFVQRALQLDRDLGPATGGLRYGFEARYEDDDEVMEFRRPRRV